VSFLPTHTAAPSHWQFKPIEKVIVATLTPDDMAYLLQGIPDGESVSLLSCCSAARVKHAAGCHNLPMRLWSVMVAGAMTID
jgi:hypothetical protein